MNRKNVLLTLLEVNEGLVRLLGDELSRMGVDVRAHFWESGTDALGQVITELSRDDCDLWLIVGEARHCNDAVTRRELSLAAIGAQAAHGAGFPVLLSPSGGTMTPFTGPLGTNAPLTGAIAAKTVAQLHKPHRVAPAQYRLRVHCPPGLGLWLEVGPPETQNTPWHGAFMACTGTDAVGAAVIPLAHGVGLANRIPERSTLAFPVQGMKIEHGALYEGWGVANELSSDRSYFVKMSALPAGLLFGPFPQDDAPEVFVLDLE
ncbi:MAG: hypothetical protein RR317_04860 [Bilophila sp.]